MCDQITSASILWADLKYICRSLAVADGSIDGVDWMNQYVRHGAIKVNHWNSNYDGQWPLYGLRRGVASNALLRDKMSSTIIYVYSPRSDHRWHTGWMSVLYLTFHSLIAVGHDIHGDLLTQSCTASHCCKDRSNDRCIMTSRVEFRDGESVNKISMRSSKMTVLVVVLVLQLIATRGQLANHVK